MSLDSGKHRRCTATSSSPIVMAFDPDPIGLGSRGACRVRAGRDPPHDHRTGTLRQAHRTPQGTLPTVSPAALLISHGDPTYRRDSAWARQVEESAARAGRGSTSSRPGARLWRG